MKLPRRHDKRLLIIPVFLLSITALLAVPRLGSTQGATQITKYDYTGPHLFSAWAIIKSDFLPLSVMANNTGIIPQYQSLEALNGTVVGMHYEVTSTSTTTTTMTYFNAYSGSTTTQTMTTTHGLGSFQNRTQTGWYWDSAHRLLYIHFQTWNNNRYHVTEISVEVPVSAPVTVTQTVTETVTVTQIVTVTSTVTQATVIWVTTTVTTTRTCTVVCLP